MKYKNQYGADAMYDVDIDGMKTCYGSSMSLGFIRRDKNFSVYARVAETNVDLKKEIIDSFIIGKPKGKKVNVDDYLVYRVYPTQIICALYKLDSGYYNESKDNIEDDKDDNDVKFYRVSKSSDVFESVDSEKDSKVSSDEPMYVLYMSARISEDTKETIKTRLRLYSEWFQVLCTCSASSTSMKQRIIEYILTSNSGASRLSDENFNIKQKQQKFYYTDIVGIDSELSDNIHDNIVIISENPLGLSVGKITIISKVNKLIFDIINNDIRVNDKSINKMYHRFYEPNYNFLKDNKGMYKGTSVCNMIYRYLENYTGLQIPFVAVSDNVIVSGYKHPVGIYNFVKRITDEIRGKHDIGKYKFNRKSPSMTFDIDNKLFYYIDNKLIREILNYGKLVIESKAIKRKKPGVEQEETTKQKYTKLITFSNVWKEKSERNFRIINVEEKVKPKDKVQFDKRVYWYDFLTLDENMMKYHYKNLESDREHIVSFSLISSILTKLFSYNKNNYRIHKENITFLIQKLNFLGYSSCAQVWAGSYSNRSIGNKTRPSYVAKRWRSCLNFFFSVCGFKEFSESNNKEDIAFSKPFSLVDENLDIKQVVSAKQYIDLYDKTTSYFKLEFSKLLYKSMKEAVKGVTDAETQSGTQPETQPEKRGSVKRPRSPDAQSSKDAQTDAQTDELSNELTVNELSEILSDNQTDVSSGGVPSVVPSGGPSYPPRKAQKKADPTEDPTNVFDTLQRYAPVAAGGPVKLTDGQIQTIIAEFDKINTKSKSVSDESFMNLMFNIISNSQSVTTATDEKFNEFKSDDGRVYKQPVVNRSLSVELNIDTSELSENNKTLIQEAIEYFKSKLSINKFGADNTNKFKTMLDYDLEFYKYFKDDNHDEYEIHTPDTSQADTGQDSVFFNPKVQNYIGAENDQLTILFMIYLSKMYYNMSECIENDKLVDFFDIICKFVCTDRYSYSLIYYNEFVLDKIYKISQICPVESRLSLVLINIVKTMHSLSVELCKIYCVNKKVVNITDDNTLGDYISDLISNLSNIVDNKHTDLVNEITPMLVSPRELLSPRELSSRELSPRAVSLSLSQTQSSSPGPVTRSQSIRSTQSTKEKQQLTLMLPIDASTPRNRGLNPFDASTPSSMAPTPQGLNPLRFNPQLTPRGLAAQGLTAQGTAQGLFTPRNNKETHVSIVTPFGNLPGNIDENLEVTMNTPTGKMRPTVIVSSSGNVTLTDLLSSNALTPEQTEKFGIINFISPVYTI